MSITEIFKKSTAVAKGNPMIFIPMLASSIFSALIGLITVGSAVPLAGNFSAEKFTENPEQALASLGAAAGGMFIFSIITGIVGLLTHSMTIGMADLALQGKPANLKEGWTTIVSRIVPVIIAAIVVGIMVSLGFVLIILPGIILAFFLMFTFISVITEKKNAFQAIGTSFKTVGSNFGATFITFLVIIGMAIITGLLNFVVSLIPILGVILSLALLSIFTCFVSIYLVCVYRELTQTAGATPEVEV